MNKVNPDYLTILENIEKSHACCSNYLVLPRHEVSVWHD